MRRIRKIIIHCSYSDFGDAAAIDGWHRHRGWDGIGYHYVILNGVRWHADAYDAFIDGRVEVGRPIEKAGAHCYGQNRDSIGICLIGRHHFGAVQLCRALPDLVRSLMDAHRLAIDDVYGHRDFNAHKTCPNIATELLRRMVVEMGKPEWI